LLNPGRGEQASDEQTQAQGADRGGRPGRTASLTMCRSANWGDRYVLLTHSAKKTQHGTDFPDRCDEHDIDY
jgi:hypothetical protein